jgi:hypothetical protein
MKNIFIYIVLGIVGLGLFFGLYDKTYPTAAIELKVPKEKAVGISRDFLQSLNLNLEKFSWAVVFSSSNNQTLYLQSVIGVENTNSLVKKDNFFWFWSVRWFRELEKEEFWVGINPETGKVEHFSHDILDEAEGRNLSAEEARPIAEGFLKSQGYKLEEWFLADSSQEKQKNRSDHHFEWERNDYKIGEAHLRVGVGILGDSVGAFYRYLKVPEKFNREYQKKLSYGQVLGLVSALLTIFIFLSAFVSLIMLIKRNQYVWRFAFYSAWIVGILGLFEFFNASPLLWYRYDTTMSKAVFFNINFLSSLIGTVIFWLVVFMFGAVGHSLALQGFTQTKLPIIAALKEGRSSWHDNPGIPIGYFMSFFFLGFVALFYYVGTKHFGVWMPMETKYSNMLGTYFPFVNPLTVGATAAISEEFTFRLFTIAFIKKYLKKDFLAVVVPALIWAFSHSTYAVFPAYIRGIELTIMGIIMGYLFLKFGLETVIITHYSINAILVSVPLLESKNLYYQTSGIAVIFLVFIPFLGILFFKRLKKTPSIVS